MIQTSDGGYAMAGYTNSFGAGMGDVYIVKLDVSGSPQWAITIKQTQDGGFVAAGYGPSGSANIVKFDSSWNTCSNITLRTSLSGTGGILGTPNTLVTSPNPPDTVENIPISASGTITTNCLV